MYYIQNLIVWRNDFKYMSMLDLNTVHCCSCIDALRNYEGVRPALIFADPPFNIGYDYETYQDKLEYDNYLSWTQEWVSACCKVLADNGSFYIAIGDEYAAELKIIGRRLGLDTRNWIIWNYSFGQNTVRKFGRSHTHIFYFVKNPKNFVFNDDSIRVPSARQLFYGDKRADSRGRIPDDVWVYPRICGSYKERVGWHTCQMPLKLLSRIIKASSNPGDLVLDPFSGSATTLVAAAVLGRRYLGFDIDPKYVELGNNRIIETLSSGLRDIDDKEESGSIVVPGYRENNSADTLFEM